MITDTQVLSYYYKGSEPVPEDPIRISSITGAEFLLIQSELPHKPNDYPILYPILASRLRHPHFERYRGRSSNSTITRRRI